MSVLQYHPKEPVNSGWMQDNCGNAVAWMRPEILDDLIAELENGGVGWVLAVLKEINNRKKATDRDTPVDQ